MARRKATQPKTSQDDTTPTTPGNDNNPAQARIDEKKQRLDFMNEVQQLIRETIVRRDIEHDAKKEHLIDQLMEKGVDDEQIAYILTKKPGRDGNEYYGFTFDEMNKLRDEVGTLQILSRRRQSFTEREAQRQSETGTETDGPGV